MCGSWLVQQFSMPYALPARHSRFCSLSITAVALYAEHQNQRDAEAIWSNAIPDFASKISTTCLLAKWYIEHEKKGRDGDLQQLLQVLGSSPDIFYILNPNFCFEREELIRVCKKWLLHHFSDVHKVIVDECLLKSFQSLSFKSIKYWASLDELCVTHSENEIAVLITLWFDFAVWGRPFLHALTDDELREISALLRVSRLSSSFRHFILQKLPWFKHPQGIDIDLLFLGMDVTEDADLTSFKLYNPPPKWFAPTRAGVLPSDATARSTFTHGFSKSEVANMIEGARQSGESRALTSPLYYFAGSYWALSLQITAPSYTLGAYLSPKNKLPLPPVSQGLKADFQLSHVQQDGAPGNCFLLKRMWFSSLGIGTPDLFKKSFQSGVDVD